MSFKRDDVSELLVMVHRRCCICHRFCGVKIETDHITPVAEGGTDEIDNAIPVCFECHAEIHSYNDQHPRGRKFLPDELRAHKAQWLRMCQHRPDLLLSVTHFADVGPLQALIDELEFNGVVGRHADGARMGALFVDEQFRRAVAQGAVSTVEPALKQTILDAYAAMSRANQRVLAAINQDGRGQAFGVGRDEALAALQESVVKIEAAHKDLLTFLSSEGTAKN